jgi:hypothetical protein
MLFRHLARWLFFFLPLTLFIVAMALPFESARITLILHGHPFARVVPKDKLNIFRYVDNDSFACQAIVFSGADAIGWIELPSTGGFPEFVPFTTTRSLDEFPIIGIDFCFIILWITRWWFLAGQAIVVLFWKMRWIEWPPTNRPTAVHA